jgi:hypothetical protein
MEITTDLREAITTEFERERFFGAIKLEIDHVSIDYRGRYVKDPHKGNADRSCRITLVPSSNAVEVLASKSD